MSRYSMLTLDLRDDVGSADRSKFYAELEKVKWRKVPGITTLWFASWKDALTDNDILETSKQEVDEAASTANIRHYDAAIAITGKPVVWKA